MTDKKNTSKDKILPFAAAAAGGMAAGILVGQALSDEKTRKKVVKGLNEAKNKAMDAMSDLSKKGQAVQDDVEEKALTAKKSIEAKVSDVREKTDDKVREVKAKADDKDKPAARETKKPTTTSRAN